MLFLFLFADNEVAPCLIASTFFLAPVAIFASAADLSPVVSDITKQFSEKFCTSELPKNVDVNLPIN